MKTSTVVRYGRAHWLDLLCGAAAICLGGWGAFAHWLAYYRYPYMRCISLFEPHDYERVGREDRDTGAAGVAA